MKNRSVAHVVCVLLDRRPDEALLSINSFQKDLSDLNPLVRAWSLRAMSGIRVRVVIPLVVMAVTKCSRDPSPYVRRCSAHAIPKIYALERDSHKEALEEVFHPPTFMTRFVTPTSYLDYF